MDRELSLVVYHSPLFPAHWALYIPSMTDPAIGKIVHVTGDARNGFVHEFKRGYLPADDERGHSIIPLARISASHVVDVLSPSGLLVYTAPDDNLLALAVDNVERELLSIPAPGKSLNVVDSLGRSQVGELLCLRVELELMVDVDNREERLLSRTVRRGSEMLLKGSCMRVLFLRKHWA